MNTQPLSSRPPHLLVFDSGVGGLSIADAIHQQHPHCVISYASDNAAFPYGTKKVMELIDRVDLVLHQLQEATAADIIVVACNTASTVALSKIRERFTIPVVGVVPAIKPAAILSQTKVIGLLATPGTVKHDYTKQLIEEFASDCEVVSVGSSELVELAEAKLRGNVISTEVLDPIISPFKDYGDLNSSDLDNSNLDTIILACTHFPLLKTELQAVLPNITHWVDSGEAIARRVGYWLDQLNIDTNKQCSQQSSKPSSHASFFTAETPEIEALKPYLEKHQLGNMNFVEIDQA